MNDRARWAAMWLLISGLALASCGEDTAEEPPGCNEDPFSCPGGQTCWVDTSYEAACLNSGQGKLGDECQALIGSPTCGDDLMCVQQAQGQPGVCTPFCNNANASQGCPNGEPCQPVGIPTTDGILVFNSVCVPQGGGGAGGGGAAGGAGGEGGGTGGSAGGAGGAPGGAGGVGGG